MEDFYNTYLQQTQRLLREQGQIFVNPQDLVAYINLARREVAMRSQSIRRLTPISGSLLSISVTNPGASYTSPTVTISAPDFPSGRPPYPNGDQATALAIVQSGSITAINVQYGGYGYFAPTLQITDSTGSGAEASIETTYINKLNQGQEVYNFADVDLSIFPGVRSILAVKSVSIVYNNYRYSLPIYSFSTYQAYIRNYPTQYQWVPTMGTQYGQGDDGSFYLYPLPSQTYQMEWDCCCLPLDLAGPGSDEALPAPWTDAVPYFAAYLAMLELQNLNAARLYMQLFDQFVHRYSTAARPGRVTNIYGRF